MKSKAHVSGHPLHPILIAFPIGFLTGTLIFDLLAIWTGDQPYSQTAEHLLLAGMISTIIAAVPGLVDYFYTVPPKSSAKKRATKHALLNVSHLVLFSIAYFHRISNDDPSETLILGLEVAGLSLMMIAGWLGGTLIHRNQISVDPRYAHAGKWKEAYFDQRGPVEVATIDELKVDQMKLLHVGDKRIVLGRTENGYVAFDDRCTHRGGSLAGGAMICGTVQCPWHGSQFDCTTGAVKAGPATERIKVYPLKEVDGKIILEI